MRGDLLPTFGTVAVWSPFQGGTAMKKQFNEDGMDASRPFGARWRSHTTEERTMPDVIGLDIAKRIFQIHTVNSKTCEIVGMKLRRSEMADFFCPRESAHIFN
jgi:hypothetical protein